MAPEKVLLVDDEIDFVNALSERMAARGLLVETAHNGEEALTTIARTSFDAVILDLAMPGMDGIETLKAMRRINPGIQVILLTGHGTVKRGIEAMKLGAMDFLEKPTDIAELIQKIKDAKAKQTAAAEKKIEQIVNDIVLTKGW